MSFTLSGPRWRDVYVSAAARAVSACGDVLAATALALILLGRGAGGVAIAALMIAAALPPVVLAPLTGRAADRLDSRAVVVVTGLVQAAACVRLAYATNTAEIVALVAVLAAGLALTSPVMSALTPDMVGRENLGRAGGIGQTAASVGGLVGPLLGGLLVGQFGAHVPLLVDAATYLALPVAGLLIVTRRRGGRAVTGSGIGTAGSGLAVSGSGTTADGARVALDGARIATDPARIAADPARIAADPARIGTDGSRIGGVESLAAPGVTVERPGVAWRLRDDPLVWPLTVLFGAVIAALSAVNVIDVFFVRQTLHSSPTMYGVIDAAWVVGILTGSMLMTRRTPGDATVARTMYQSLILVSLLIAAFAAVPSAWWLIPMSIVGGTLNGVQNVVAGVLVSRRTPAAFRGRAFARFGAIANAASGAGLALGGILLAAGASPRVLIAAAGTAGVLVIVAFGVPLRAALRAETTVTPAVPVPA